MANMYFTYLARCPKRIQTYTCACKPFIKEILCFPQRADYLHSTSRLLRTSVFSLAPCSGASAATSGADGGHSISLSALLLCLV